MAEAHNEQGTTKHRETKTKGNKNEGNNLIDGEYKLRGNFQRDQKSDYRDYLPPLCCLGSGHISQGRIVQGTDNTGVTHRPRTNVRGHILMTSSK